MDPYLPSGMMVSPTVAFTVSNCQPGFGLFCTWIFHCDETAVVEGAGAALPICVAVATTTQKKTFLYMRLSA